jgi:hypothetical protein
MAQNKTIMVEKFPHGGQKIAHTGGNIVPSWAID